MERLTRKKCGEILIKYNDGEYRSPCFGCESINKCNPEKVTCGFYKALEKLAEYEELGTVEEYRRAMEKQKAKKVIDDTAFGTCSSCHNEFNSELISEYNMKYCIYCGQAIDRRETL